MFQVESEILHLQSDILFTLWSIPVSNAMLAGILTTILLLILAITTYPRIKNTTTPSKYQLLVESLVGGIVGFIETIVGSKEIGYKIAPLIGTLILYIGLSDVLPLLIPGLTSMEFHGMAVFRTHTSDFSTTFGLSLGIVFITHLITIKQKGFIKYIDQFIAIPTVIANFKEGIGKGFMSLIDIFVGMLNIVGEFAKALSLSLRLFGNMFAGDLLMGVFFGLFAIIIPAGWTLMSLFSGVIQALVFGALSASFCASAFKQK